MELDESTQCTIISTIAQLQSKELVVVFTNLRQSPFRLSNITESGREVSSFVLDSLSYPDSMKLISQMVELQNTSAACLREYRYNAIYRERVLSILARWSGGRPRLCQFAALAISTASTTCVMRLMQLVYESFIRKYQSSSTVLYNPREAVVLALLGVVLPPEVQCNLPDNETVDKAIARGVLSREHGHKLLKSRKVLS